MATGGSLICVGCGIKGVAHITLETAGWIRSSDVVCYCCSDPATVVWIRQHARESVDLAACYSEKRDRGSIYAEMTDIMLSHVRAQRRVCVVFYGHPGVFVYPTHVAIAKAREEGFPAVMLPGVSAADCLFADLGFDPSQVGCVMYEATDLLLRRRTITLDTHLIIWQIGVVGLPGFNFGTYRNRNIGVLVDYLVSYYGADHRVCHYQAAQFPMCSPVIEWTPLGELGRQCRLSTISTLYVPPQIRREMDLKLGERMGYFEAPTGINTRASALRVCGSQTAAAGSYVPTPDKSCLAEFINRMGEQPELLCEFIRSPEFVLQREAGLTDIEITALLSRDPARVRVAIKSVGPDRSAQPESPEANVCR